MQQELIKMLEKVTEHIVICNNYDQRFSSTSYGANILKEAEALVEKAKNSAKEPAVPQGFATLNEWFLSLPEQRQAQLREDKWMLAGAAFEAGQAAPAVPAWVQDVVIEYQYNGGTHWCPLGPAERAKVDFDGVYRLKPGTIPTEIPAPAVPAQTFDEVWAAIDWNEWRMKPIRELIQMIHSKTIPAAPSQPLTCGNGCSCLVQCGDTYAHAGLPSPKEPVTLTDEEANAIKLTSWTDEENYGAKFCEGFNAGVNAVIDALHKKG